MRDERDGYRDDIYDTEGRLQDATNQLEKLREEVDARTHARTHARTSARTHVRAAQTDPATRCRTRAQSAQAVGGAVQGGGTWPAARCGKALCSDASIAGVVVINPQEPSHKLNNKALCSDASIWLPLSIALFPGNSDRPACAGPERQPPKSAT